jgi:hypothetical protein
MNLNFFRKKFDLKKAYKKLGLFCTVEPSEVSYLFGEPILKIVTYYEGEKINSENFSEERWEEKGRKEIPRKIIAVSPKEFERLPAHQLLLGRLELPRIGLLEEEIEE